MHPSLTPSRVVTFLFFLSLVVWAAVFYGKLPAITDVFLHIVPGETANLREWAQGRLPLWDPTTGCGTPQWANGLASGAYPPYWLWALTGLFHGLVLLSLLHLAFAFTGFYLWARKIGIAPTWASLSALSFAGSLHLTRLWAYPIFMATQSWTPWLFYFAARTLEEGRLRWGIGLTLAAAFQILAGYPHFALYAFLFLGVWVLIRPEEKARKVKVGVAMAVALGLSCLHWLPFLDYLGYAARGGWSAPGSFPYALRLGDLVTLFSPTALGTPEMEGYRGLMANANFLPYFGLLPLAAWVLGPLAPPAPGRSFWGWSALAFLLWMMGPHFPPWGLLPGGLVETLEPSKAVGVFLLAVCTYSGLALTMFFRRDGEGREKVATWIAAGLWILDLLSVAPRTLHPVPDPFLQPALRTYAADLAEKAEGGRVLSLRTKEQLVFRNVGAEGSLFSAAADGWVGGLLANSQGVWGIRSPQAYLSVWVRSMSLLWAAFNRIDTYSGILPDITGVRLLLFPVEFKGPRYRTLEKGEGRSLMENTTALPDAWPALSERLLPGPGEALTAMEGMPPGKGPREVLLTGEESLPAPRRGLPPWIKLKAGWHRVAPCQAVYQGDLSGSKWFFWNETFAPGWRAWVDGKPAPIRKAFGFFMAVALPPGSGQVEFRYEPTAFRLGCFLSLVFLLLGPLWMKALVRKGTGSPDPAQAEGPLS